jgi:hypothetical protein
MITTLGERRADTGTSTGCARGVSADGERIDGADKPADELRLRHRSPADHPLCWWAMTRMLKTNKLLCSNKATGPRVTSNLLQIFN